MIVHVPLQFLDNSAVLQAPAVGSSGWMLVPAMDWDWSTACVKKRLRSARMRASVASSNGSNVAIST